MINEIKTSGVQRTILTTKQISKPSSDHNSKNFSKKNIFSSFKSPSALSTNTNAARTLNSNQITAGQFKIGSKRISSDIYEQTIL